MGVYRTSGILPELSLGAMVFFSIVLLIGGILLGTHQVWWIQLLAIVGLVAFFEWFGPGEMSQLTYIIPLVVFVIGVLIGDISWAIQTGVEFHMPEFTNPFVVK